MADSATRVPRPYVALGEQIATRRNMKGWTQRQLAERVGYHRNSGSVTIARIEGGIMRPSDDRLEQLAIQLDVPLSKLQKLAGGSGKFNPLAGAQLHRANQRRVSELNARTQTLQTDVDRHFVPLREARRRVEQYFLEPFIMRVTTLRGAEHDLAGSLEKIGRQQLEGDHDKQFSAELATYRNGVARSMAASVAGAATGGAAAGDTVGAGVAFATYSAIAAWASASTGTAIAGLSGAAASSTTMAALGGGSLAAGGFGVAGGAAALASIVATPAMLAAGVALLVTNKKWKERENSEAARIDAAEHDFNDTDRRVRDSFDWTSRALAFLSAAEMRAAHLLPELEREQETSVNRPVEWATLNPKAQQVVKSLLQLAAVTATVLPLPVVPTPNEELSPEQIKHLETRSREWNEAVLAEAMAWFAIG